MLQGVRERKKEKVVGNQQLDKTRLEIICENLYNG